MSDFVKVKATARQNYAGRWYSSGDVIEGCSAADADDLVAMRLAERVKEPEQGYLTRRLRASNTAVDGSESREGRIGRRDFRAKK